MAPLKEHPRHHIVSVRINDLEKAILTSISARDKSSLSEICRDALYANFFRPAGYSALGAGGAGLASGDRGAGPSAGTAEDRFQEGPDATGSAAAEPRGGAPAS